MISPRTFHAIAALFAVYMLVRNLSGARALFRREARRSRPMAIVSAVNVLLALVILAVAVKGLAGGLMSP